MAQPHILLLYGGRATLAQVFVMVEQFNQRLYVEESKRLPSIMTTIISHPQANTTSPSKGHGTSKPPKQIAMAPKIKVAVNPRMRSQNCAMERRIVLQRYQLRIKMADKLLPIKAKESHHIRGIKLGHKVEVQQQLTFFYYQKAPAFQRWKEKKEPWKFVSCEVFLDWCHISRSFPRFWYWLYLVESLPIFKEWSVQVSLFIYNIENVKMNDVNLFIFRMVYAKVVLVKQVDQQTLKIPFKSLIIAPTVKLFPLGWKFLHGGLGKKMSTETMNDIKWCHQTYQGMMSTQVVTYL